MKKDLKTKLFEGLGEASMCWLEFLPEGTFDSTRCKEIGDDIWSDIEKLQARIEVLEKVREAINVSDLDPLFKSTKNIIEALKQVEI